MQTFHYRSSMRLPSLFAAASFFLALLFVSHRADAQCTTSSLIINTAEYNYTSLVAGASDPRWVISDKGPAYIPSSPPVGASALVVSPPSFWTGSGWISDNQQHANPGVPANNSNYMTFQRSFTLCEEANVTFNLNMTIDNYVQAILIDGVAVPGLSQPYTSSILTYAPAPFSQTLSAGVHTLEIKVGEDNNMSSNPVGMSLHGTITAPSNVIVNDFDANCEGYVCAGTGACDDKCYWRVTGNNISGTNNIFGTLTNHDVNIITNGMQRGVIKNGSSSFGGFFGWNTMTPTARFHVNCINGNDGIPSDIRFENLEPGQGSVLVIDDNGYVYNSRVDISKVGGKPAADVKELQQKIEKLEEKLEMLQHAVETGTNTVDAGTGNELFQNTPNPFGNATNIEYKITSMQQSAYIIICDLNGRELLKYTLQGRGRGVVTVDGKELQPGMYLYSLVIDGREADTKKMIVSR